VLTTLLEDTLYDLPDVPEKHIVFDRKKVKERLDAIVQDEDLRKYIL
jgi:ATP-dependent HslUV protease ATP-binding subunit HslU